MKKIILLVITGILFVIFLLLSSVYISVNNRDTELRNLAKAQQGKIEVVFDQMAKIISGKAQVTTNYKDSFKDIFVSIIEGRYSKGDGSLLKLVQEQNPTFDASLYKDLMVSIEAERNNFTREQEVMLDIIREHDNLIKKIPKNMFLSNKNPIEYKIISSSKTKETMKTGIEEDQKIF